MSNDKNVCCDSSKCFLTIVNVHITRGHSWTTTLVEMRVPVIHVESLTINDILDGIKAHCLRNVKPTVLQNFVKTKIKH